VLSYWASVPPYARYVSYEDQSSRWARQEDASRRDVWEHHYATTQGSTFRAALKPACDPLRLEAARPSIVAPWAAGGTDCECRAARVRRGQSRASWNLISNSAVFPPSSSTQCILAQCTGHHYQSPQHYTLNFALTTLNSRIIFLVAQSLRSVSYYRVESSPWYKLDDGCGCCAGALAATAPRMFIIILLFRKSPGQVAKLAGCKAATRTLAGLHQSVRT